MATQMSKFGMIFEQVTGSAPGSSTGTVQLYASSSTDESGKTILLMKDDAGAETVLGGAFKIEDSDGTELAISGGQEIKFVDGGAININWTDTSDGVDGDEYDLSFTLDIQNLSETTTVADGDLVVIDDGAGGTLRKMTRANFIESAALDNIDIDGGAIDGAVIGANSAAAGSFTTLGASGVATMSGHLTASAGIEVADALVPASDDAVDLGRSGAEFKDLYLDGVAYVDELRADQLGAALDANDQAITNINVDSGAIDGAVIGANSAAAGSFTTLGASGVATMSGHLTASAGIEVADRLVPASDDAVDLGASGAEFKDLYLDGVAYIDDLRADTGRFADLTSGSLVLAGANGALINDSKLSFDAAAQSGVGVLSVNSMLSVTSSVNFAGGYQGNADQGASFDASNGNLYLRAGVSADGEISAGTNVIINSGYASGGSSLTSDGNASFAGDLIVDGKATVSGHLTASAGMSIASELVPSTDDAVDLGASGAEFKDLYLDGVAYVDELQADALGKDLDAGNFSITNVSELTASHIQVTTLDVVTINSVTQSETTLEIQDKLIVSALSASSAVADGGGLKIGGGDTVAGHASVLYDHANLALDLNIAGTTQVRLQDGVFRPETDDDVDLGASGAEFKDLYLDGVAYIDSLQADQLGAALDANNQAITNINVDSGAIDGVTLGGNAQVTITDADMNGGTIDNVVIGGTTPVAGTFTALSASQAIKGNANLEIAGVGYFDNEIYVDGGGSFGESVTFNGQTVHNGNSTFNAHITASAGIAVADVIVPSADDVVDLGRSGAEFRNLYLDGIAYVDNLQADQLGAALDANDQAITNINVDSGAIDGTVIGGNSAAAGSFTTLGASGVATMSGHLTASAGIEVSDALVPSADDAVDLGRSGAEFKDLYLDGIAYVDELRADTGKFADLASGSLVLAGADGVLLNDSKLTFDAAAQSGVGVLYVNSMLSVTSSVNFAGGYMANADYGMSFDSSNGTLIGRGQGTFDGGVNAGGGYGGGSGASIGSNGNIQTRGVLQVGADGAGQDVTFFGGAANEALIYDASENHLKVQDSSAANIVTIGGDATTDYAIDVADGVNNINKIRAAAFVTYSDESLKTDVQTMNTALDTVMSLNGVEFTWKDSGARDFGFIAQEVQKVVPKAVHTANDGVQGVDYSRLTSILVEAVKAQQVQIEDLKKVITNLKK